MPNQFFHWKKLCFQKKCLLLQKQCGSNSVVERWLPKPKVAGSNPVYRSYRNLSRLRRSPSIPFRPAWAFSHYETDPYFYCFLILKEKFYLLIKKTSPYFEFSEICFYIILWPDAQSPAKTKR